MAKIAYLKNDFICIGGADYSLGPSDFDYYIDNVPASPSISHIETVNDNNSAIMEAMKADMVQLFNTPMQ